jgi:prolyl-tRNA synthetase
VTAADLLKSMAVLDEAGRPAVVLVPGDRDVRLPAGWRLFEEEDFDRHPALVRGYVGPGGLQAQGIRVVADFSVERDTGWITGANRAHHHVSGARLGRDFEVDEWGSFAQVAEGDPCPNCGKDLSLVRSVEAAHTFQLGHKYSDVMTGGTFVTEDGGEATFAMGCFGMGVSRLLSVVAEEHHDEKGLVWPAEVAPYQVHLLALGADRSPDVAEAADRIYGRLLDAGVEVLFDDRDLSPGVKFADADLLGIPVRLVVGAKGLGRGVVEWRSRASGEEREVAVEGTVAELVGVPVG